MKRYLLSFLLFYLSTAYVAAQWSETIYTKGLVTVTLTNSQSQFVYQSDQLLAGLDRNQHAFIYKISIDSIMPQWSSQGFTSSDPFQEDFVEIVIKNKSYPIDMNNYDGEDLKLDCEIIFNGVPYNETAEFKGFHNSNDDVISTSFRIELNLTESSYYGQGDKEFTGELEIVVNDAMVNIANEY